jgi:hypothetical protein
MNLNTQYHKTLKHQLSLPFRYPNSLYLQHSGPPALHYCVKLHTSVLTLTLEMTVLVTTQCSPLCSYHTHCSWGMLLEHNKEHYNVHHCYPCSWLSLHTQNFKLPKIMLTGAVTSTVKTHKWHFCLHPDKRKDGTLLLGHNHFLPLPFQTIIH